MFTGLIEATGTLLSRDRNRITLEAPALAGRWRQGDSIAVSGTCLTAIPTPDPAHFAADLAAETLERTTLGALQPGSKVNLELPTPAGSPLGGHVVQGHVDGVATLVSITPLSEDLESTDWRLTLRLPPELASGVLQQGSITVNGISLTVAKLHDAEEDGSHLLEIAVIPHTYRATNLCTLQPGAPLNIETDILARYARQNNASWAGTAAEVQAEWLTPGYLLANGY